LQKSEVSGDGAASKQQSNSETASKPLHPSWLAKQQQKKAAILPFQGKKVVFGEDD
jgi:hypothetical protein